MAAQKKRDAFTEARIPLPEMAPCYGCGKDGNHESEMFVLVEGSKWYCRACFRRGPGHGWPGRREPNAGVNKPALRRPALRRPSK